MDVHTAPERWCPSPSRPCRDSQFRRTSPPCDTGHRYPPPCSPYRHMCSQPTTCAADKTDIPTPQPSTGARIKAGRGAATPGSIERRMTVLLSCGKLDRRVLINAVPSSGSERRGGWVDGHHVMLHMVCVRRGGWNLVRPHGTWPSDYGRKSPPRDGPGRMLEREEEMPLESNSRQVDGGIARSGRIDPRVLPAVGTMGRKSLARRLEENVLDGRECADQRCQQRQRGVVEANVVQEARVVTRELCEMWQDFEGVDEPLAASRSLLSFCCRIYIIFVAHALFVLD
ncbi:hypothetical protein C8Q80DRAFT_690295 [Daedaleopsis nitida]|nr:hypothetical protein C8Q80DRAFT_690295 [Daedaleopsis nitida]